MATNKNAQLRYQILDRCFSNFQKRYEIEDLRKEVNEQLKDIANTDVSDRQIREDIKFMRDRMSWRAPIVAYPYNVKSAITVTQTRISPSTKTSCLLKKSRNFRQLSTY